MPFVLERMRYVTRRTSAKGKERWYWQRPGHKLTRLPDDPALRFAEQQRLNLSADGRQPIGPVEGSIGWMVAKYKESDSYRDLKPGTVKYYVRFLREIEDLGPALPFSYFTRKQVIDFIQTYEKSHQRRQVAAVLKNLMNIARYHGFIEGDPTSDLRLKTMPPRDRVWTGDEIKAWLVAAKKEHGHVTTAFNILRFTAQRPGDVLAMTWAQYNGRTLKLRQQKTGTLIEVPCHPELKTHLDGLLRESLMIVSYRGRGVPYLRFNERFRRVGDRSGIDAQARDLRRTAMIRMAEAGSTTPEIASVSGHSIHTTQRILDTYLPKNVQLAQAAITRLAEHKSGSKV